MLTWKFVGASKASVLYVYIDYIWKSKLKIIYFVLDLFYVYISKYPTFIQVQFSMVKFKNNPKKGLNQILILELKLINTLMKRLTKIFNETHI